MIIKRRSIIDFCFFFYIVANYANFSQLLIHLFSIPSPLSQFVNYFPLILVLYGWHLIPAKKYYVFNKYFAFLLVFIISYLIIGFISTCVFNAYEQILRFIPQFSRALLDLFLFITYFLHILENRLNINKQIFLITIVFFVGTASVVTFYLLGFELFYVRTDQAYGLIERPSGLFVNPNIAARNSCITLILLICYLFKEATLKTKLLQFTLIVFTIFTIFITFSNTGQIAAIGILIIGFVKGKLISIDSLKIIGFLMLISAIVFQTLDTSKLEFSNTQIDKVQNLYNVLTLNTGNVSYSSREYIAKETLRRCKENPIVGYGLGSYTLVYKTWGTHNTYLGLLLDAGFIPLTLFVLFLLYLAFNGYLMRNQLSDVGFMFMSWSFLIGIYSFASHNILEGGKFYFISVLIFALYSYRKMNANQSSLV